MTEQNEAEGDEPFREAYIEISQIVGRQGSESHSLADDVRRLKAADGRLRAALRAIKDGTVKGTVGGNDVVWFDEITTLYDFCDQVLEEVR